MAGRGTPAVDLSRLLSGAAETISRSRTCWLVTLSEEGIPRCRPMSRLPSEPAEGWVIHLVTDGRSRKVDEIWHDQRVRILCQARGGAFVGAAGRARLIFEAAQVRERWRPEYDAFFPGAARDEAAFVEVAVDQLDLWIPGATPEPFGIVTTTVKRDARGRWTVTAPK